MKRLLALLTICATSLTTGCATISEMDRADRAAYQQMSPRQQCVKDAQERRRWSGAFSGLAGAGVVGYKNADNQYDRDLRTCAVTYNR